MERKNSNKHKKDIKKSKVPYNFIPFVNKVFIRYENITECSIYVRYNKNLLSGCINYEIRNPLYI